MSSYMVMAEVSRALQSILWDAFSQDNDIRSVVPSRNVIVFTNPTETVRDSANRLSLWLYQVTENEFLKNQPRLRGDNGNREQFPPMALNLFYLVTPFAPSGDWDQLLLGKTMQVLYDNAIVVLANAVDRVWEELRIIFSRLSLEELTRIWDALREPYRLSVCYQVRVTRIDSQRQVENARIIERSPGYGTKPVNLTG
jgi:hypothetical protein